MRHALALGLVFLQMFSSRALSSAETLPRESVERLHAVVQILVRSTAGRTLVDAARQLWGAKSDRQVVSHLKWDRSSRTDAVLIRHFNPVTGVEERERKITISLRSSQRIEEVVLDLAHELTHAVSKPAWDPYDPELSAGDYLTAAIEGAGGEIEAVATECRVAQELSTRLETIDLSRCSKYLSEGSVDAARIREDFYRVGRWYPRLVRSLGKDVRRFPHLSSKPPRLFSSTGHAPYPAALLDEFAEITSIACQNSRARLQSVDGREPASESGSESAEARLALRHFLKRRCSSPSS